ncbi:hypothetical protein COO60DRAFT_84302 [Scenedesmus sp. NREL 46B-D3]|nr:hypothetical protein COO60DRAFT_84302 [Scenedesmus sp. NREL 46B-D3]
MWQATAVMVLAAPDMQPREVTTCLWALSKLRYRPPEPWLAALADRAAELLPLAWQQQEPHSSSSCSCDKKVASKAAQQQLQQQQKADAAAAEVRYRRRQLLQQIQQLEQQQRRQQQALRQHQRMLQSEQQVLWHSQHQRQLQQHSSSSSSSSSALGEQRQTRGTAGAADRGRGWQSRMTVMMVTRSFLQESVLVRAARRRWWWRQRHCQDGGGMPSATSRARPCLEAQGAIAAAGKDRRMSSAAMERLEQGNGRLALPADVRDIMVCTAALYCWVVLAALGWHTLLQVSLVQV